MFYFQGKGFTLFCGFFNTRKQGGLKWWHNLSSRKNKLQIGLKILWFTILVTNSYHVGWEDFFYRLVVCVWAWVHISLWRFFFFYKTVASFLTLFHKNSQMLVKNTKFGTNFGKPVKITLPQFCKQRLVGEICLRFFFFVLPCFVFTNFEKIFLPKIYMGISFQ